MASASLTEGAAGCCASRVMPHTLASGSRVSVSSCYFQRVSFRKVVLRSSSAREAGWMPVAAIITPRSMSASTLGGDLGFSEIGFRGGQHVEEARQEEPSAGEIPTEDSPATAFREKATAVPTRGGEGGFSARGRWDRRNRGAGKRPPFARDVTVALDQLVPGAVFSGKVVAIESFGAFIDIGAFTDGLLHISQIKDDYISDVREFVTKGQEVAVKVTAVDAEKGRISFTMKGLTEGGAEGPRQEERRQSPSSRLVTPALETEIVQGRPVRIGKIAGRGRQGAEQPTKSVGVKKGQDVSGVVKSIIRNGVFLTLGSGDEGYLRASDADNPSNLSMESLYKIGQSLDVRVMRIERGRISLTMKKEVDLKLMNQTINNNETFQASNPFELAFRQASILVTSSED